MDEQARRWQQRIDDAFPHGVIMTADDESNGRTVAIPVPRPEVVAMRGLNPVVFLDSPDSDRNMRGEITAWEPLQDSPCRVVRVTMDFGGDRRGIADKMRWSGNITSAHAAAMRPHRHESLRLSEEDSLYQGREEP